MEIDEEWPQICSACNISIPNQVSLIAHKNGRKHILKAGEYERRQEEDKRTIFVSGAIMKTPEVAQLLLRNYFEENYGVIEKINVQHKFCFIVFEEPEAVQAALSEINHEFGGYRIKIKGRKTPSSKGKAEPESPSQQLRNKFNSFSTFNEQYLEIENSFSAVEQSYQSILENFIAQVKKKCDFYEMEFNLIGSARINLMKQNSDIDITVRITEKSKSMLMAGLEDIGRGTVRSKGAAEQRLERPVTRKLFTLAGGIKEISKSRKDLTTVHAVPGARKPLIRLTLNNQKIELSVDNIAAEVNTEFVSHLNEDPLFRAVLRVTRFMFEKNEIILIGRMTSYSVVCLVIHFLTKKGYLNSIANEASKLPKGSCISDALVNKAWDYRVPKTKLNWPNEYGSRPDAVLFVFIQFVEWLVHETASKCSKLEKSDVGKTIVFDTRYGETLPLDKFYERYELNGSLFKESPLMIADPFEIEHNTTGQISARNLERIQKAWKRIILRAKMKKFTEYVNDPNKNSNGLKDWGVTLLLPECNTTTAKKEGCSTTNESMNSSKNEEKHSNSVALSGGKLEILFKYLTEIMRIEVKPIDSNCVGGIINSNCVGESLESLEETDRDVPEKKMKTDQPNETEDRTKESVPLGYRGRTECSVSHVLWVGRRKIKRKINSQYKNCSWIDVENQITNQLLATAEKYKERQTFHIQVQKRDDGQFVVNFDGINHDLLRHIQQSVESF